MAGAYEAAPMLRCGYVQLRAGREPSAFEAQTAALARLGRIYLRGQSPETDPTGSWFELHLRSPVRDLAHLRLRLASVGIEDSMIHSVRAVTRAGEGRTLAKQLDLFGRLA
jgi:hypothetical protein